MTVNKVELFEIIDDENHNDFMRIREYADDGQIVFTIFEDEDDDNTAENNASLILNCNNLQDLIDILQSIADKYKAAKETTSSGPYR